MQAKTGKPRRWRANRGIALVAVLWVIVLLAAMAISFVGTIRTETSVTRNLVDNAGARALADAGVYRAVLALYHSFEEVQTGGDSGILAALDEAAEATSGEASAGNPVANDALRFDGRPYLWPFENGVVQIAIQSEAGKIDLNAAREDLLLGLLRANGAEQPEVLVDRIADFRDPDKERRPQGAEDADYEAAGRSQGAKDAPFESVAELQQVIGVSRSLYDRLAPALTVYSEARGIDPLTAPAAALRALPEIDPSTIEALLAQRQGEDPDLVALLADFEAYLAGPGSLVYSISSEALTQTGARFRREAIVALVPGSDRPFRVFSWKQGRSRSAEATAESATEASPPYTEERRY
ncbi:MAG: type II secretion system protein GspK [Kiloniellales bacterium]|nr:type II secretion system protein GspK [Kiloniellales bacterium]